MRILLAGAPGAGKGTQAALVSFELDVPHISSGDVVRETIASGAPAGAAVRDAVARGDLVPDEALVEILRPTLAAATSQGGYVLDGFPRTVAQAKALLDAGDAHDAALDVVVHLDVPDVVLIARLRERGRDDDTEAVIEHRLAVYREQTLPMLDWFEQRRQLVVVHGDAPVDAVHDAVVGGIQAWLLRRRLAS